VFAEAAQVVMLGRRDTMLEGTTKITGSSNTGVNVTMHVVEIINPSEVKKPAGEIGAWAS
jgi:hypothetical protein